jgi:hypothetical protein
MDSTPIYKLFAPKGKLLEPRKSSHPILTDGYEIHPAFITMVLEQTFREKKAKIHMFTFENLSNCVHA